MYYLKTYPVSFFIIIIICYLSLFKPPQTELDSIPHIDKLVHLCMYGGLTCIIWTEYLYHHKTINAKRLVFAGILLPICMSGMIEIIQATCTDNRSGDWFDFLANTLGVIIATILVRYIIQPFMKKHIHKE
ncbi:VanZ family protein [uncultured Bacteroides sp.]|uniref:VanZ family protein n=1 Tax=uncultured Bacteroides sp. TaxID=162156 RepID=UPI00261A0482|nr:VanZ family protein [uncultured Bacteroides sp.]